MLRAEVVDELATVNFIAAFVEPHVPQQAQRAGAVVVEHLFGVAAHGLLAGGAVIRDGRRAAAQLGADKLIGREFERGPFGPQLGRVHLDAHVAVESPIVGLLEVDAFGERFIGDDHQVALRDARAAQVYQVRVAIDRHRFRAKQQFGGRRAEAGRSQQRRHRCEQ